LRGLLLTVAPILLLAGLRPAIAQNAITWATPPPATVTAGQQFPVGWGISGSVLSPSVRVDVIDPLTVKSTINSTDPRARVPGSTRDLFAVSSNSTIVAPTTNPDGTLITILTVVKFAVVDAFGVASEIRTVTINPKPPEGVDLLVRNGSLTVAPTTYQLSESPGGVNVDWIVENRGSTGSTASKTRVLVRHANGASIADVLLDTGVVAAGTSGTRAYSLPIQSTTLPGQYTIEITVDADDLAGQLGTEKSNDTATISLNIEPPPPIRIGLNFGADEVNGSHSTSLEPSEIAGAPGVEQGFWNNLDGVSGVAMTLIGERDGNAVSTDVTVQWASVLTWASTGRGEENNGFVGPNRKLMAGYMDTDYRPGVGSTTTVAVNGIPLGLTSPRYDVYVYTLGGVAGRGGGYRIVNPQGGVLRDYLLGDGAARPESHIRDGGVDHSDVGTFVVFRGLDAPNIVVEATTEHGLGFGDMEFAPINAIQIVPAQTGAGIDVVAPVATPEGFKMFVFDSPSAQLNPATVTAQLNWNPINVVATKINGRTEIRYDSVSETGRHLMRGYHHMVQIAFLDQAGNSTSVSRDFQSNQFWGFVVGANPGPGRRVAVAHGAGVPIEVKIQEDLGVVVPGSVQITVDGLGVASRSVKEGPATVVQSLNPFSLSLGEHTIGLSFNQTPIQPVTTSGDPVIASSSNSPGTEGASNAIDGDPATKYLNFDTVQNGTPSGFVVTPSRGPSIVNGMQLVSANDAPERDPGILTLEGSNDETIADFASGTWTQIVRLENEAFRIALNGASERPTPVTTAATGIGTASLIGNQFRFQIEYSGLSGVATGAHLHGPATTEQDAGVLIDLEPLNGGGFGTAGTLSGTILLTDERLTQLRGGLLYVNVHTAANPGGEIRGQVLADTAANGVISGWTERRQPQVFTFNNTTSYKHYRWTVLQTQAPNECCAQIGEVVLIDAGAGSSVVRTEEWKFTVDEIVPMDPGLEAAVIAALGRTAGPVTLGDMAGLTSLDASNRGIFSLNGIEKAVNLQSLYLKGNSISNVTPLGGLTDLSVIDLADNRVRDIGPINALPSLSALVLDRNPVGNPASLASALALTNLNINGIGLRDLGFVASLTGLQVLDISNNYITDLSPLFALTQLTVLNAASNLVPASGFSGLSALTTLRSLNLSGSGIVDVSWVAALTGLTELRLGGNAIVDISGLAGLTAVTNLELQENRIGGIGALAGMTGLVHMNLAGNRIVDIAAIGSLTSLSSVDLRTNFLDLSTGSAPLGVIDGLITAGVNVQSDPQAQLFAPSISIVSDWTLASGVSSGPIGFYVSDEATPAYLLQVEAVSDNQTLIPNGNLVLEAARGQARSVRVTPVAGQTGVATISLTVTDEEAARTTTTFTVTVSDAPATTVAGSLLREVYFDAKSRFLGGLIDAASFPDSPLQLTQIGSFESPSIQISNYGQRISGYITAPATGDYVFYLAADDQAVLFLSTDTSRGNLRAIAREPEWTFSRDWTGTDRRPNRENISVPIALQAGQRYYLEAVVQQGGGGENLAVAWQRPGDPVPENGSEPIPGQFLSHDRVPSPTPVTPVVVFHPRSQEVRLHGSLVLSVAGAGGSLSYQWKRNGTDIPGATNRRLILSGVGAGDAGDYTVNVSNGVGAALSNPATVTVLEQLQVTEGPYVNPANGHFYYRLKPGGWRASEGAAAAMGGHLVTINDLAEQEWVVERFRGHEDPLWVGLFDTDPFNSSLDQNVRKTEFQWVSGESVTFESWAKGEPNDWGSNGEGFAQIRPLAYGNWNDATEDNYGSGASGIVELVYSGAPVAVQEMKASTVVEQDNLALTAFVHGDAPLTYVWTKDGQTVAGVSGPTLFLSSVNLSDSGTYAVTVTNGSGSVHLAATVTVVPSVSFADSSLENAVRNQLGIFGRNLSENDLAALTSLAIRELGITHLGGLEKAVNLEFLDFHDNQVSSLEPLRGLVHLAHVGLGKNPISDFSALTQMPGLRGLDADELGLTDLSVFSGITLLEGLSVRYNQISDLTPLRSFPHLKGLDVGGGNPISNFAVLGELTTLETLSAWGVGLTDLSVLSPLVNLRSVQLAVNGITDIAPLAGLTGLTEVLLGGNAIQDISSIVNLPNLTLIDLESNAVADIAVLGDSRLVNLQNVNLRSNLVALYEGSAELTLVQTLQNRGVTVLYTEPVVPSVELRVVKGGALESGSGAAEFEIVLSEAVPRDLNVTIALGGTATAGVDFGSPGSSILIPAQQSSRLVSVTGLNDTLVEGPETVTVTVQAAAGYILGGSGTQAILRIIDDELPIGGLRREIYRNIAGYGVSELVKNPAFPEFPSEVDFVDQFESIQSIENYGQRLSGWILPPITGDYVFYLSSDDQSELYLSTDHDPANMKRIAYEPSHNAAREWTGGFDRDSSKPQNISAPIHLVQGQGYYVELWHKGAGGRNEVSVAWQKPGDGVPPNGSAPIPGEFLEMILPQPAPLGYPNLSDISNQTTPEETATSTIVFGIGDGETPVGDLIVSARSSRPDLVPIRNIVFGGTGPDRTLVVTPLADAFGELTLSVTVQDGDGHIAVDNFLLTITGINDPPRIEIAPVFTVAEGTQGRLAFYIFDDEAGIEQTVLDVATSNPGLVDRAGLSFEGHWNSRTLLVTPVPGQVGDSVIVLSATDPEGLTRTAAVQLSVIANDPVTIPDPSLDSAVRDALQRLQQPPGTVLTVADMLRLRELDACCRNIESVQGLQAARNLTYLNIGHNHQNLSDYTPILGLSGLKRLYVGGGPGFQISKLSAFPDLELIALDQTGLNDVSGLAAFTQLKALILVSNNIQDISPLLALTELETLQIDDNPNLTDYSPLLQLPHLRELSVGRNPAFPLGMVRHLRGLGSLSIADGGHADISPLAGLVDLWSLNVSGNPISDLSPLRGMLSLRDLYVNGVEIPDPFVLRELPSLGDLSIEDAGIRDLGFLRHLPSLGALRAGANPIQDLAPLVGHAGLRYLNVRHARLDLTPGSTALAQIQSLQTAGVNVEFDPQSTAPALGPIADQTVVVGGTTSRIDLQVTDPDQWLFRYEVRVSNPDLFPESGIAMDREQRTLQLSPAAGRTGTATVTVTVIDSSQLTASRSFAVRVIVDRVIEFADANVLNAVREAVRKPTGDITSKDLAGMRELWICCRNITTLEGLQNAFNLENLDVGHNPITDFSPIRELKGLKRLYVNGSPAFPVSEIAHLPNLEHLSLSEARRDNLTALSPFTQLRSLELRNVQVVNIAPLGTLNQLHFLDLAANPGITDYAPLRNLPLLENLRVSENPAFDLNELNHLNSVTVLWLENSGRTDISILGTFPRLTALFLDGNPITDLTPLLNLPELRTLGLNYVPSVSPSLLANFSGLHELYMEGTDLSDLGFVGGMRQLRILRAANNPLTSIAPVVAAQLPEQWLFTVNGALLDLTDGSQARLDIQTLQGRGMTVEFQGQNTAPTLEPISNQTVVAGTSSAIIRLNARDEETYGRLAFEAASQNQALVADSSFEFGGDRFNRTLRFVAQPGQQGATPIQVTVRDVAGLSAQREFIVNVVTAGTFAILDGSLESALRESLGKPDGLLTQSDLLNVRELYICCRGISNLGGLEAAANLETLDIGFNALVGTEAFAPLRGLSNLRNLYVHGMPDFAISELSHFPNLETIGLGASERADLSGLTPFTQLKGLELWNNNIQNLTPLASLTGLERLNISWNPLITDFSPLQGLSGLISLHVSGNKAFSLADLSGFPNLDNLGLGAMGLTDISVLAGRGTLTALDLWDNPIADLSPLQTLTGLRWLNLDRVPLSQPSQLSSLVNVTGLVLSNTGIHGLDFLAGLANLESLYLGENPIQDIDLLRGLSKLRYVDLRGSALDTSAGSPALIVIQELRDRGVQVDVGNQNTPPSLGTIATQTVTAGRATSFIALQISDLESQDGFVLRAESSNPSLVPVRNVLFGGTGNKRSFSIIPASTASGVVTLTITVVDPGGLSASQSFEVKILRTITLPDPLFRETFETTEPGTLPAGWSVQNSTDPDASGLDLNNSRSDSFKDWVVISRNRVLSIGNAGYWDSSRRLAVAPGQIVNGAELTTLVDGRFVLAESHSRVGSQVQFLYTPTYDLSGQAGVRISFNSIFEQAANSMGAVEVSTDAGATWSPVVYMLDEEDVARDTAGAIDAETTFAAAQPDAAQALNYGAWIGVDPQRRATLAPYISPRVADDPVGSKRLEVFKVPQADNQSQVQFRFFHVGASSRYFGIDNFAIHAGGTGGPGGGSFASDFNFVQGDLLELHGSAKWKTVGGLDGSGFISLTDADFYQEGWVVLPDLNDGAPISGFVATFKLRMGGGTIPPADGFSFNYAALNDPVISSGAGWVDGHMEEGTPTGVAINFDTWDNGAEAPAIDLRLDGQLRTSDRVWIAGPGSAGRTVLNDGSGSPVTLGTGSGFADVRIEYASGALNLQYKGVNVYSGLPMPSVLQAGRFILGARTGGASDNHWVENLQITTTVADSVNTPPGISPIPNLVLEAGVASPPINFLISDLETQAADLTVEVVSADPSLIPQTGFGLGGTGAARSLVITPGAGQTGVATVTVKVSDGQLTSSGAFTVKVESGAAAGNLVNGSFETGDFTGWIVNDMKGPFSPLAVSQSGARIGLGQISVSPTDGQFAATTGFDGEGPDVARLAQEFLPQQEAPFLVFEYRAGWQVGGTKDRLFQVKIASEGGGTALLTQEILRATAGSQKSDTGPSVAEIDLTQFAVAGKRIRLSFEWQIPESFTGPAEFQLDNVRLVGTATGGTTSPVVTIPDANLQKAIRERLGKPSGDLTDQDLAKLTDLWLVGKGIANLQGIEKAVNLEFLDVASNPGITVFTPLNSLAKLRFLGLGNLGLTQIPDLSTLPLLNSAILNDNPISDLSPLLPIKDNLVQIDISGTQVTDYSLLSQFGNLLSLGVRSNGITDLSVLGGLTGLFELRAGGNPLTSLTPLAQLTSLESLSLVSVTTLTDYSPLGGFTGLTRLNLSGNNLTDTAVAALAPLANLRLLVLTDNGISNISPLANLTRLEELFLGANPIIDYSVIKNFRNLTKLSIRTGNLNNLDIIPVLSNLEELNLQGNQLTDLKPLLNVPSLSSVDVRENNIDINAGSAAQGVIQTLRDLQVSVQFEPQRTLQGTPPSISRIEDQITSVGNAVGPIPVTVSDAETPVENLTITPLSTSNPDLIPLTNVIVSGSGANQTIAVVPASGQTGVARIVIRVTDADGRVADTSFQVTVVNGTELRFVVGNVSGARFTEVTVPVSVRNFIGITGFQYSIHWDPSVATFVAVEQFNLTGLSSSKFGVSQAASGTLTALWTGTGVTLPDDAVIYRVRFKLTGGSGKVSPVRIDGVPTLLEANNASGTVAAIPVGGALTIQTGVSLTGKVAYYNGGNSIPGVNVALSGGRLDTAPTGTSGSFSFAVGAGADYAVELNVPAGQSGTRGVTILDVIPIQLDVLSTKRIDSPYQLLAADVDGSSKVTMADASLIRSVVLGLRTGFDIGDWRFVPAEHQFVNPASPWSAPRRREFVGLNTDALAQDFIGIRLGDVNGSWASDSSVGPASVSSNERGSVSLFSLSPRSAATGGGTAVRFQIGAATPGAATLTDSGAGGGSVRKSVIPGGSRTLSVPILVSDFADVTSAQFTVQWNPEELEFMDVTDFGVRGLGSGNFGSRFVNEGKLTFAWDDPQGVGATVADGSRLFSIGFKPLTQAAGAPVVRFADNPTPREVGVQGRVVQMITLDGSVGAGSDVESGLRVRVLGWNSAGGGLRLELQTRAGHSYSLESAESLDALIWQDVDSVQGDGGVRVLSDPGPASVRRFYRVREE
jgi:Leucine-rich repeat (LRR) protein